MDLSFMKDIVQASSTPVGWFYSLFGGAFAVSVMPLVKKAIKKQIEGAFKKFINGESAVINSISDPDLKESMLHLSLYIKKNGVPSLQKQVVNLADSAQMVFHNPIANEVIDEIESDLNTGLSSINVPSVSTTTTTTMVGTQD